MHGTIIKADQDPNSRWWRRPRLLRVTCNHYSWDVTHNYDYGRFGGGNLESHDLAHYPSTI